MDEAVAAGSLPPPADADDLLLLLCSSFTVRSRLERFARSSPVGHTQVMMDIEEEVEAGISRGTLHPEVLLDWYPLERLADKLYPPPSQLTDLLRAERLQGDYAANPHPLHTLAGALDSDFRADLAVLADPQVLGPRRLDVFQGRFAPGGRVTLRELAAKHNLSRTRIQHIERAAAYEVARTFQAEPLPYFRSAILYAGDLLPAPGSSRPANPISEGRFAAIHARLGDAIHPADIHTFVTLWIAISTCEQWSSAKAEQGLSTRPRRTRT